MHLGYNYINMQVSDVAPHVNPGVANMSLVNTKDLATFILNCSNYIDNADEYEHVFFFSLVETIFPKHVPRCVLDMLERKTRQKYTGPAFTITCMDFIERMRKRNTKILLEHYMSFIYIYTYMLKVWNLLVMSKTTET